MPLPGEQVLRNKRGAAIALVLWLPRVENRADVRPRLESSLPRDPNDSLDDAIFLDEDVPDKWKAFIELNAEMVKKTPSITERKAPLAHPS